jgi:catechol 2,3-dioxygenase-like lactoylglutathione lyase family enzyme
LRFHAQFYDAVLGTLGIAPVWPTTTACATAISTAARRAAFGITTPLNGEPATHGNGSTVGFVLASPEQADAWHAAGVANGGTTCEDPPGWRDGAVGRLYLAYLRDPDGNKICALHRPPKPTT